MGASRPAMEALRDLGAVGADDHAADAGVGTQRHARASRRARARAASPPAQPARTSSRLPSGPVLTDPGGDDGARPRSGHGRSVGRFRLRALPIRTLTVGPGVPPGQPATGGGRVADFHRRCGVSPPPEHASMYCSYGPSLPQVPDEGQVTLLSPSRAGSQAEARFQRCTHVRSKQRSEPGLLNARAYNLETPLRRTVVTEACGERSAVATETWCTRRMPRVYDALGRTDELALAMNALLVEGGARAVSLRGACRRSGVSPASAMNHYGNWDRLQALGASLTGQWRDEGIRRRREAGLRAFLPDDAEDLALGPRVAGMAGDRPRRRDGSRASSPWRGRTRGLSWPGSPSTSSTDPHSSRCTRPRGARLGDDAR